MDPDDTDDYNDATWAQMQEDEQQMLTDDPGYVEFLISSLEKDHRGIPKY
jgi:hypothetical protein